MELLLLHFAHESIHGFVFWNHYDTAHMRSDIFSTMPTTFLSDEILDKGDTDHIVIFTQNRKPGEPMFNSHIYGLGQGVRLRNRHHVRKRHHYLASNSVTEFNN